MFNIPNPIQLKISKRYKKRFGCISKKKIKQKVEGVDISISYHDLYHLEVSKLDRIQIGKYYVSGIHGINSPLLHPNPIQEEYSGLLDEVRVAYHEWMTRTSIYNTVKLLAWMGWLIIQGINPLAIFWRHYQSLNKQRLYADNS
ncbi:MAG: hypothetical protein QNJ34_18825 [Xenococcaceae cyanobacterium MO_188.B29]|nr:hypothetical protein [Xenococcaceae cyanobacterium MO_188.B29]